MQVSCFPKLVWFLWPRQYTSKDYNYQGFSESTHIPVFFAVAVITDNQDTAGQYICRLTMWVGNYGLWLTCSPEWGLTQIFNNDDSSSGVFAPVRYLLSCNQRCMEKNLVEMWTVGDNVIVLTDLAVCLKKMWVWKMSFPFFFSRRSPVFLFFSWCIPILWILYFSL